LDKILLNNEPEISTVPEDHPAYFIMDNDHFIVALTNLTPTRRRSEGVAAAARYMLAAARGEIPKRVPILVAAAGEGKWLILDGNSTFAVAQASGWSGIPCQVAKPED
jgi:hypothetical protein